MMGRKILIMNLYKLTGTIVCQDDNNLLGLTLIRARAPHSNRIFFGFSLGIITWSEPSCPEPERREV